jgi:hypothetical protein
MSAALGGRDYERSVSATVRAARGVFYTPDPVADLMAKNAIAFWLAGRQLLAFEQALRKLDDGESFSELRALQGARIVDPSCGAGALLGAAQRALRGVDVHFAGTDIDAGAVALARKRLGSAANLAVGDALLTGGHEGDIVLTNPPYGAERGSPYVDRYVTFWGAAASRVKRGGVLAVLAPTSWQTGVRYLRARHEVIEPSGLARVVALPRGTFADAYIDPCIALCAPAPAPAPMSPSSLGARRVPQRGTSSKPQRTTGAPKVLLGDLFASSRGILAPAPPPRGQGLPLLVGPLAPFVWPAHPSAFARVLARDVREGKGALAFATGPRLLIRRIVGRASRLTCVVAHAPAVAKKDFYVFMPRDPGLSLEAYAALLHARPVAERLATRDVAATKADFAQLTLTMLRELEVPRLLRASARDRRLIRGLEDDAIGPKSLGLASAWLEARAREAEEVGRALLSSGAARVECDPRWNPLRNRLDSFVERMLR